MPTMVYFQMSIGVIIIAILSGHLTTGSSWLHFERTAGISWNYENQESWPEKCLKGKTQSPIALSEAISSSSSFEPFSLVGYEKAFNVSVMNNGHTVVITLSGETPRISGGGLSQAYVFEEMHFHWCSEHTVENRRFPLEAHFVHYGEKYKDMVEALGHQDGVAVLGVLFDTSEERDLVGKPWPEIRPILVPVVSNGLRATPRKSSWQSQDFLSPDDDDEFEKLVPIIPTLQSKVNQPTIFYNLIFRRFLPRNLGGFYRYEGSLTTPYCNEVVVWTVFTSTIQISQRQVDIFQGMHTEDSKILGDNYRYLQPLNSRKLYLKKTNLLSDHCNGADTHIILTDVFFMVMLTTYFQMNVSYGL